MKKILFYLCFFFFFIFFFTFKVEAQNPPAQGAQEWKCLRGDDKGFTFNGASSTTFTQNLYADGFPLGSEVYVVTCVGTQAGAVCTSGNPTYDQLLFNNDNTKLFPYAVTITGGSKQATNLGKLTTSATVTTSGLTGGLVFYGVLVGNINQNLGAGAGEKLAVFSFGDPVTTKCVTISWNTVFPPPPPPPPANEDRDEDQGGRRLCRGCRWDPFGIVFDSQSLEPMPNVVVTILDKDKAKYNLLGLTNPQTTKADGLFNFLVEPGLYYLSLSQVPNHSFTSTPNLNSNFIKIYHKIDGSNSIYKPDESITEVIDTPEEVEQGYPNMEHRDIPLDPGTNSPYIVAPSTVSYSVMKVDNATQVDGKVSHPFTTVTFMQGAKEILKLQADRFGYYSATLADSSLQQDIDVSVIYTKAELTNPNLVVKSKKTSPNYFSMIATNLLSRIFTPLYAQGDIRILSSVRAFTFSPSFSQIQGYAYDKNNAIASSAKVSLKLDMNKASFYETTTDQNGYFSIPKENIPLYPYHVEIASQKGASITYSPTDFAKKNKEYLAKNNLNLVEAPKENKVSNTNPVSSNKTSLQPTQIQVHPISNNSDTKISALLITVIIIILCLAASGVTVYFMIKKRQSY